MCAWPATAAQPAQSLAAAHLIVEPIAGSTEEYERRLREFLAATEAGVPASGPLPSANASASAQPSAAPPSSSPSAASSRTRARSALQHVPPLSAAALGGGKGCSASPRPASPPTAPSSASGRASAAAAEPQRAPHRPGSAQPQPAPHPASPTPVDWRHMLRMAREAMQHAPTGPQVLTDTYRRVHTYLRISLTERCNLRCTYCMPDEGVELTPREQLLTTPEIMRLARIFVEAGVTKIRLTGGEPTLRQDIVSLAGQLSALPGLQALALTSNGIVLGRQLPALKEAGLSAVNISLDTLRPERFLQLSRRPGHAKVMAAIRSAVELGYDPVKVNVVVMRGVNDDEVADFAALTADQPINVRFIEYMPFDGNVWSDSKMVPFRELLGRIQAAFPHAPLERLDDPAGEVAKNFRLKGHRGSVSFITSMTQHFCSDCNRLRLLADGNLKVCLFGSSEVSLRDAMRGGATDDDLRAIIGAAVRRKRAAHAGMFELAAMPNRPMITIGG